MWWMVNYRIDKLLWIFNIKPREFETDRPAAIPLEYNPLFITKIAATRDKSMEFKRRDKNHLKIFSRFEGKVGAAAVLYVDSQMIPESMLCVKIGDNTTHTIYDAILYHLL